MEKDISVSQELMEIEVLEFRAGGNTYGIDISDVKEILSYVKKPRLIPNAHPFIEGLIMPRDCIITVLNFCDCLELSDSDDIKNEMLIVTGINNLNIAFHVDSVQGIHRIMKNEIKNSNRNITTAKKDFISGFYTNDEGIIVIIDLKKIILSINSAALVD